MRYIFIIFLQIVTVFKQIQLVVLVIVIMVNACVRLDIQVVGVMDAVKDIMVIQIVKVTLIDTK